ncbi:MAG: hypothetical protein QGG40_07110, partial [Myxococcota bacterium]|nr:hypothetical protein [Myxococcota bacterium]
VDGLDRIDRILLLPWGVLPLVADGVRSTNPWIQLHFQSTLEGLVRRRVEPGMLWVLPPLTSLESRVKWVRERIGVTEPPEPPV